MRIIHRITLTSPVAKNDLVAIGFSGGQNGSTFEIDENDSFWPAVRRVVDREQAIDIVRTEFDDAEIARAAWLTMSAEGQHGYPQPEATYKQATYDLTSHCSLCGVGGTQSAPFQMKAEPSMGRRGILQLNWVFDEFFVTREVWQQVFQPRGIEARPVVSARSRDELRTVVQLVIPPFDGLVVFDEHPFLICPRCGEWKYAPITRGMFPPLTTTPRAPLVKTRESFGSGAVAFHEVIVSQELVRDLRKRRIRGAAFMPIKAP